LHIFTQTVSGSPYQSGLRLKGREKTEVRPKFLLPKGTQVITRECECDFSHNTIHMVDAPDTCVR